MPMYAVTDRSTRHKVVNGSLHALGSDRAAIEQAIAKSRKNGAMSLPPVTITFADGRLNVVVPDVGEGDTGREASVVPGW